MKYPHPRSAPCDPWWASPKVREEAAKQRAVREALDALDALERDLGGDEEENEERRAARQSLATEGLPEEDWRRANTLVLLIKAVMESDRGPIAARQE